MAIVPLESIKKETTYEPWKDLSLATERNARGVWKYSYLPEPEGDLSCYVIGLKKECPRKNITLFGLTFEKEIFKPITEQGQMPEPVMAVAKLAENQVEAIKKRASVTELEYFEVTQEPHPMNPQFNISVSLEGKTFKLIDYIIIRKLPISDWQENTISMYEMNELMAQGVQQELPTRKEKRVK